MSVYDFAARTIDGKDQKLDAWKGKVVLVVNVASKCGFTPQYTGLEAMHRKFKDQGLPPGTPMPTSEHPIQSFQWGDYTPKPDTRYRYRVATRYGTSAAR